MKNIALAIALVATTTLCAQSQQCRAPLNESASLAPGTGGLGGAFHFGDLLLFSRSDLSVYVALNPGLSAPGWPSYVRLYPAAQTDALSVGPATNFTSGFVAATNGFKVGDNQVVGMQQPAIADADATIADLTAKLNALLAEMRAHGLIAK